MILETIDRLLEENKPKEAERYMKAELDSAIKEDRFNDQLMLLNELIGFYRQTSEKDKLVEVIGASIELIDKMSLSGSIHNATTWINIANALRSIGELDKALKYYEACELIYEECIKAGVISDKDMILAGYYNNLSLLYQEMNRPDMSEKSLLKALEIVEVNDAKFEYAVTLANLANTTYLQGKYDEAEKYANDSIMAFKKRNIRDPHLCAAMVALANCYMQRKQYNQAIELLVEALKIIEETFGHNSQYERVLENIRICESKMISESDMNGMMLSKLYYEEYGKDMIHNLFPEYETKIAIGLVGEGSDCYGYDDELSRDHDYGPDFCMWVSDDTYDAIGERLSQAYGELPDTYMGITRTKTAMGNGRRGVFRISDFYKKYLKTERIDEIDYNSIPDYCLAVCTNGEVYRDDEGIFTSIRDALLQGYPSDIRLRKLARDMGFFSQSGQYNYMRMIKREDYLTAQIMLGDFCKAAMTLYHHYMNVYPPHDKWLAKSTSTLVGGDFILAYLNDITSKSIAGEYEAVCSCVDELADYLASLMYSTGEISDTDNYLDHHIQELLYKSEIVMLDHKTIVDRIARLEFKAFDKVQNEGGRASCQNDWLTFSVMRKSQYLTWTQDMLVQYLYDFNREYELGHNLITEKYGRMMESTAPEKYMEIKENFPPLSDEKKMIIEQIVAIQMAMVEDFAVNHPNVAANARSLHTDEDNMFNTSYETYLRGEISTYSDKMLQLYGQFVIGVAKSGGNIAQMTIENTAKLYGFDSIEAMEAI